MNIGSLDRRIDIQRASIVVNDYGERTVSWSSAAVVWAAIERKDSASERNSGEQTISLQSVVFRVRWSSTVNGYDMSNRIVYGSKNYKIIAIQEIGRRDQLRIVTELIEN